MKMRKVEKILSALRIPDLAIKSASKQYVDDPNGLWKHFVKTKKITEQDFFEEYAREEKLEFVDLKTFEISPEALSALDDSFFREKNIVPLAIIGEHLTYGTIDPDDYTVKDEISATTYLTGIPKIVTPTELADTISRTFRADAEMAELTSEIESANDVGTEEEDEEIVNIEEESPVVKFVNLLIYQAIQDRASDIHVEPGETKLTVRYRIDGVLHVLREADRKIQNGVVSRLKIMSDIDIGEKRKPQDGRMSFTYGKKTIDIRVVTLPTTWGEKVVMRILDHSDEKRSITSIGMTKENEEIFYRSVKKPHGMILVTGPTGSGKSTTIYTVLDEVAKPEVNVVTVEDPVEKKIKGISQMQINNKAGMTFPNALKSILRADPDIVFLGEIRDDETAKIAVDASMTGHLVLSTLHTNGAPEAAARLIEMGVEPYLVGTTVSCVVAQRLARKLCEDCKQETVVEDNILDRAGYKESRNIKFYKPVGCKNCANTGYKGRLALTEVMELTEELEPLIIAQKSASEIRREAEKHGLVSLKDDGFVKVSKGLTTIEEVLRVAA